MVERIQLKVSKDRKYFISKEQRDKYGFRPGKTIVFEKGEDKRVIGYVR